MLYAPYAPPTEHRHPRPQQHKRANYFALMLFALTAVAALLVKYLG
jgi:hypothetical protein